MVRTTLYPLIAVLIAGVAVTGCTSSRISALDTATRTQPAPLTPAPAGTVTSGQLPPPASPTVATAPTVPPAPATDANGFPVAPETPQPATPDVTSPADTAAPQTSVTEVATAAPVSKESMGGVWNATSAGTTCRIATSLTKGGNDYRAASLGCGGELSNVGFWNLSGNKVVLKDRSGNAVATLFSSGNGSFDGQTVGGRAISLTR